MAVSLEDTLMTVEGLILKATAKITEISDGGMRCDLPYSEGISIYLHIYTFCYHIINFLIVNSFTFILVIIIIHYTKY